MNEPKHIGHTKESLLATIRELSRQGELLQRKYEALLRKPERLVRACLGLKRVESGSSLAHARRPGSEDLLYQGVPQVSFHPERLFVSRDCAHHFLIMDIKVGMNSQLVSPDPLPASLFAVENIHRLREVPTDEEFTTPPPITFDAAYPGMYISVIVRRLTDSEGPFECLFSGSILELEDPLPLGPVTRVPPLPVINNREPKSGTS